MTMEETSRTAVLIDDERIDQMLYRRTINKSGLIDNVHSFQYAEEALDYLKSTDRPPINVIFLDINMPRMNGFEFLDRALETLGPDFVGAVVVMLTTSLDTHNKENAASYDIIKY